MNLTHILLLLKVKLQALINGFTKTTTKKRLRKLVALLGGSIFFFFIYQWIYEIFSTLIQHAAPGSSLIDNFIIITFLGFFIFLLASGITVSIHYLFISSDLPLLMVAPLANNSIFTFKLIEAVFANSTFFFFMGIPIFIAYGIITHANWYFYPLMVIDTLIFLSIPISISFLGALFIIRIIPANRARELTAIFLAIVSLSIWLALQLVKASTFDQNSQYFSHRTIESLQQIPNKDFFNLLPSTWAARALMGFAHDDLKIIALNFVLLFIFMIGIFMISLQLCKWAFSQGFISSPQSVTLKKREKIASREISAQHRIQLLFSGIAGSIYLRDFKLLIRDTRQIVNMLLLAVMMVILPLIQHPERFDSDFSLYYPYIFLAIFSAFLSSQISSRLIPLEGKSFWITRLIPQSALKIISGKFLLAFSLSALLSWIAIAVLGIYFHHPLRIAILAIAMTLSLSGMISALGLLMGCYFSRFDWDHPKRMLSSTGGFILSLASLLTVAMIGGLIALTYTIGNQFNFSIQFLNLFLIVLVFIIAFVFIMITNLKSARKLDQMEWQF